MNPKVIKDESEIPKGAIRMHLYNPRDVLMPRGSMKKESIGPYLLERLKSSYEEWTDPKYGDNPVLSDLIKCLYTNLMGEVEQAWLTFIEETTNGLSERDLLLLKLSVIAAAQPEYDSVYIKWFIDTITSDPKMFVEAIAFIDKFDRCSNEFVYFTNIHIKTVGCNDKYNQMMDESGDPGSELGKLFAAKAGL
jgi:hypothetical protein